MPTASRLSAASATDSGEATADTKRVLVDVQTRNDLAVIDPAQGQVIDRHALPGCDHDHGLQLDLPHRRAFVACDGNNRLLQVDLTTFTVTANFDTGSEPDVLTLDANLGRLYVLAESGVLTVVDTRGDTAQVLARRPLADGAHSGAVDPDTHTLYVPLADVNGKPVLRVLNPD